MEARLTLVIAAAGIAQNEALPSGLERPAAQHQAWSSNPDHTISTIRNFLATRHQPNDRHNPLSR